MISPELLSRYTFFNSLTDEQLKDIAMICEEKTLPKDSVLFKKTETANKLILLLEGTVNLSYSSGDKGSVVNAPISPGEIFGVSSLIGPYKYTASAYATAPIKVVDIDVTTLRMMTENDQILGNVLMRNVAAAVYARLHHCTGE